MIVDDIQEHHEPKPVGGVDQRLQVIRGAIGMVRRVRQNPIVAPISLARKIIDRHKFNGRYTQAL